MKSPHMSMFVRSGWSVILALTLLLTMPVNAFQDKEASNKLDSRVFFLPEMRLPGESIDIADMDEFIGSHEELAFFQAEHGEAWSLYLDLRRDVASILTGGAIPFIPGSANSLSWKEFAPGCADWSCVPLEAIENLTRDFLVRHQGLLGVIPAELHLFRDSSGPVEHMYFITYKQVVDGISVKGATVNFRINRGNLIQVATENYAPVKISTVPILSRDRALKVVSDYLGDFPLKIDDISDKGSLILIPMTPRGQDPDSFSGQRGSGVDHALAYRIVFTRAGSIGTWEALVDAHRGELLSFVDTNNYGMAHGYVYPGDGHTGAVDRVFPFAHTNLPAPDNYTNVGGQFPGDNATIDFAAGKFTRINDSCGSTSLSTTTGDADYGLSIGTDCGVPSPNQGSGGNTWSAKVQFYHLTMVNIKARTYYPTNTWLNTSYITVNVNQAAYCNASSGGGTLNFYKAAPPCWNLGELPGVSLHEWGHSWDNYDGSGSGSPPLETRADWTASIQIRDSCVGRGAGFSSCGAGDTCLNCSGVRDHDYWQHQNKTPWKASNHGTFWGPCASASYNGPCGGGDHCESGMASQALWDMVKGERTAPEPSGDFFLRCGMDEASGWQLLDRLFWTSHSQLGNMYSCSGWVTSGCGGNTLYELFMSIDDDGDGTANGTPHAAGIFAALYRHELACGLASDPRNQNHVSVSCPDLDMPVNVSTIAGDSRIDLSWGAVTDADRYDVYRNESGCNQGYTRIAQIDSPTTSYSDMTTVNGITYYYRIQAYAVAPGCTGTYSPISQCAWTTPQSCAGAVLLDRSLHNCFDKIIVTVLDSSVSVPVQVQAWSTTDATLKTITLDQNQPGGATYTGSVTTTTGSAGATQVRVSHGDTVTVRYTDSDWCGTPNQNVSTGSTIDCQPPVISNVQVSQITPYAATVTWTTDENSDSTVTWGEAVPPTNDLEELTSLVTSHSLTLTGLTPCTEYFFSVSSADEAANQTTEDNSGAYFSFTTMMVVTMFADDMESGSSNWTAQSPWALSTESSHSPSNAWSDSPGGNYGDGLNISLTSDAFDLSGTSQAELSFWHTYALESGWDYGYVEVSTNGSTWTNLATVNGTNMTWTKASYDISAYTGNPSVQIRFRMTTDSNTVFDGWHIDDVNISHAVPCVPLADYAGNSFSDSCPAGGVGDGDGYLDAGEYVTFLVDVRNSGSGDLTGVSATLTSPTAGVVIIDGSAGYGDILEGMIETSLAPHFTVHLTDAISCGTDIDFTLSIQTDQGNFTSYFTEKVGLTTPGDFTVLDENFEGAWGPYGNNPPAGWSIEDHGDETTPAWNNNDWHRYSKGGSNGYVARAYYTPVENQDEWLITPAFDFPATASTINLDFDHYFYVYGTAQERGYVDIKSNQTPSWTNLITYQATTANMAHATISLMSYIGQTGVQIRFRYTARDDWYWEVDNVNVSGTQPPTCEMIPCESTAGAVTVPTGNEPGTTPVGAVMLTDAMEITWDAVLCASPDYHIIWGWGAELADYTHADAECAIGTSGSYIWSNPPDTAGDFIWFLVLGNDGAATEGGWGQSSTGDRSSSASGRCGTSAFDNVPCGGSSY